MPRLFKAHRTRTWDTNGEVLRESENKTSAMLNPAKEPPFRSLKPKSLLLYYLRYPEHGWEEKFISIHILFSR